jgi:hypothetical protein
MQCFYFAINQKLTNTMRITVFNVQVITTLPQRVKQTLVKMCICSTLSVATNETCGQE